MTTNELHGAGLRASIALFFHKSHFCPNLNVIEIIVEHALFVKIHFARRESRCSRSHLSSAFYANERFESRHLAR